MCCTYTLSSGTAFNSTTVLHVLAKPSVEVIPYNHSIGEGEAFTLSCHATVPGTDYFNMSVFSWSKWVAGSHEDVGNTTSEYPDSLVGFCYFTFQMLGLRKDQMQLPQTIQCYVEFKIYEVLFYLGSIATGIYYFHTTATLWT